MPIFFRRAFIRRSAAPATTNPSSSGRLPLPRAAPLQNINDTFAALPEPPPVIAKPATVAALSATQFNERFAAAEPQGVASAVPAEPAAAPAPKIPAPKLAEAPKPVSAPKLAEAPKPKEAPRRSR